MAREEKGEILRQFDVVFDEYNNKKITKELMLKRCEYLHKKLLVSYTVKGI
jgi:hypothetical protein